MKGHRAYPRREHIMSKAFAEKIIDSMVDENGHCGERGLSGKQFEILAQHLHKGDEQDWGFWEGNYTTLCFWGIDYEGNIGKYHVVINEHFRFNMGYNVVSIDLRDPEEYQAELDAEAKLKAMRDFSGSEWVAEPKKRLDITLTLVNDYVYEGCSYSYYDDGTRHIYTFRDADGNCFVWKTQKVIDFYDDDAEEWTDAEVVDTIQMKATVKEHSEYKGTKQTVITRPKIIAIRKGM